MLRGCDDWTVVTLALSELYLRHVQLAVRVLSRSSIICTGVVSTLTSGCAALSTIMDLWLQLYYRGIQFLRPSRSVEAIDLILVQILDFELFHVLRAEQRGDVVQNVAAAISFVNAPRS